MSSTYRTVVSLVALVALLAGARSVSAQVEGVSYTLSPVGMHVYWDGNAGLTDGQFFGGQMGFGLGQYFEINGVYLISRDLHRDFTRFTGVDEDMQAELENLRAREVDLQRIGAEITISLYSGSIVPFIRGGTGILRFAPEGLRESESIYLNAGAGLRLSLADRFSLTVEAENFGYQYNPAAAMLGGGDYNPPILEPRNFRSTLVNNWSARASLGIYLGGRRPGELSALDEALRQQFAGGLGGLSLQLEPYFGQIDFNEAFNFNLNQRFLGGSAGIDFGPLVGFRGFFWQALEENALTEFDDLRMFGGEVKMNLSSAEGIVPYLLLGGGYADVGSEYTGRRLRPPESQPFAFGGAGLRFNLIPNFRVEGGVRVLMMNSEGLDNQISPSRVYASPAYSVGVSFGLGRAPAAPDVVRRETMEERLAAERAEAEARIEEIRREAAEREQVLNAQIAAAFARQDTAAVVRLMRERDEIRRRAEDPVAALVERERLEPPEERRVYRDPDARTMTIPVPEEGEIYIRYGTPGGVAIDTYPEDVGVTGLEATGLSAAEIRRMTREAVQEALAREGLVPTPPGEDPAAMERRIEERILSQLGIGRAPVTDERVVADRRMEQLERRLMERLSREIAMLRAQEAARAPLVLQPDPRRPGEVTFVDHRPGRAFSGISAFTGVNVIGGPQQFLVGVKADYGMLFGFAQLLPDFTIGMGQGTSSYNLNANVAVPFRLEYIFPWSAYAGGGVGLLAFSRPPEGVMGFQTTINLLAGGERVFGPGNVFVEYLTLNFLRFNRLQAGYRMRF